MVIQNGAHSYVAVQKVDSRTIEQYLCRRMEAGSAEQCRLALIPKEQIQALLPWLQAQKEQGFSDLWDFFAEGEQLCVVTAARPYPPLVRYLSDKQPALAERLSITAAIFTELLLQGMDDYFCCAALSPERIGVSAALEIGFQYDLDDIAAHADVRFAMTQQKLAALLKGLFEKELSERCLPELETLFGRLLQGDFASLLDVWQAFVPIQERYSAADAQALQPMSLGFRIWERLKRFAAALVWLWKLLLIVLALLYLVVSVQAFVKDAEVAQNYGQIGTLELKTD